MDREEERFFFSNILTLITVIVSLLIVVMEAVFQTNIALNGSTNSATLTPQQLVLIYAAKVATIHYFGILFSILFVACLLRYLSSWERIQKSKLWYKVIRYLSWIVLMSAIVFLVWLFYIYSQ